MGVRLHRRLDAGELEPAEYRRLGACAVIGCPACGVSRAIGGDEHQIDASGCVSPIVVCLNEGCPFGDFVELTSWGGE